MSGTKSGPKRIDPSSITHAIPSGTPAHRTKGDGGHDDVLFVTKINRNGGWLCLAFLGAAALAPFVNVLAPTLAKPLIRFKALFTDFTLA